MMSGGERDVNQWIIFVQRYAKIVFEARLQKIREIDL
jgi:hypothetical protein